MLRKWRQPLGNAHATSSTPNATTRTLQAPQISRHRSALIPKRPGTSAASNPWRSSF